MSVFTFKGISSDYYGLKVKTLQPPQRAESTTEYIYIPGRTQQLVKSREEYTNTEIVFEVMLKDLSKVREVFAWLKGEGQLIYSDEPDKYYEAISNSLISTTYVSDKIREFQIKFVCKPFAYAVNAKISTNAYSDSGTYDLRAKEILFKNNGTFMCEPVFHAKFCGRLELSVDGQNEKFIIDTGQENGTFLGNVAYETTLRYKPPEIEIYIDSSLRLAYTVQKNNSGEIISRTVVNELTTGQFPLIPSGTNTIRATLMPKTFHRTANTTTLKYAYYNNLYNLDIYARERWL